MFVAGCRSLQENGITKISLETFNDAEAAAEGSLLGIWKFQEFKSKKEYTTPEISIYESKSEYAFVGIILCWSVSSS